MECAAVGRRLVYWNCFPNNLCVYVCLFLCLSTPALVWQKGCMLVSFTLRHILQISSKHGWSWCLNVGCTGIVAVVTTEKQQHRLCKLPSQISSAYPFDSKVDVTLPYATANEEHNQCFVKRIFTHKHDRQIIKQSEDTSAVRNLWFDLK